MRVDRLTAPFARADPVFHALTDLGERHPWLWLGMRPPDPRRSLPAQAHVWYLGAGVVGFVLGELLELALGVRPIGRALQRERATSVATGVVVWLLGWGAWERRARRRRWSRPFAH